MARLALRGLPLRGGAPRDLDLGAAVAPREVGEEIGERREADVNRGEVLVRAAPYGVGGARPVFEPKRIGARSASGIWSPWGNPPIRMRRLRPGGFGAGCMWPRAMTPPPPPWVCGAAAMKAAISAGAAAASELGPSSGWRPVPSRLRKQTITPQQPCERPITPPAPAMTRLRGWPASSSSTVSGAPPRAAHSVPTSGGPASSTLTAANWSSV